MRFSPLARLVRALVPAAALTLAAGCGEDRERLDVPRVYLVLEDTVAVPGDTVRGRIYGADDVGGVVRLAARLCIDFGFLTYRINPDRVDSISVRFALPVPATTPQNALVIVEGQVNDDQNFFVSIQDTIVARSPGVPPAAPTRQPSCAPASQVTPGAAP